MSDPANSISASPESRTQQASLWAAARLGRREVDLRPVSGDASFRRYFRLAADDRSLILMDAPPEREDSRPFIDIDRRLREAGLPAPEILHFDLELGFSLLEDFGDTLYRELIDPSSIDHLWPLLLDLLEGMATRVDCAGLPHYGPATLLQELDLFTDWYLARHRQRRLTDAESALWGETCTLLLDSALTQPQVFVHKDFHSCNLLQTPQGPGLIDFQDGLRGPLSYDLVSLLWDRYLPWPRERLEQWIESARRRLAPDIDPVAWLRFCDLMGLQRNLKIVGIFARLWYRDGKHGYLEMIPRFYGYLLEVSSRYPELTRFHDLLEQDSCAP